MDKGAICCFCQLQGNLVHTEDISVDIFSNFAISHYWMQPPACALMTNMTLCNWKAVFPAVILWLSDIHLSQSLTGTPVHRDEDEMNFSLRSTNQRVGRAKKGGQAQKAHLQAPISRLQIFPIAIFAFSFQNKRAEPQHSLA